MSDYNVNLSVHAEDDVLIITTDKIASSFIRNYYEYDTYKNLPSGIHLPKYAISLPYEKNSYETNIPRDTNNEKLISITNTLDEFLNKKYTKDVLILIRNPWNRFISAFVQDYIKPLFNNTFISKIFISTVLKNKLEYSESYNDLIDVWKQYDYLLRNIESEDTQVTSNILPIFKILLKEILLSYVSFQSNSQEGHNGSYHTSILSLVNDMNTNSKIKILDISNDNIEDELRKYNFKSNYRYGDRENTSTFYTNIINDLINREEELKYFKKIITESLSEEILSYNKLYEKRNKL